MTVSRWRGRDGSFWAVVPTRNLRDLIIRNRARLMPTCNYTLGWTDKNGFGVELAHAEWVKQGMYVNI